ncbi:hypothetical protein GWK08_11745 [Leptobacterium flavescens]|uniref:TonB-dependent receptor plug domain-containing protein n=1 Tax=Leptobacterium flavescens TaxID=472055 RepID=A0A6P0UM69_9FLAO|nr:hypothetical protein [Leptobacterium flavescens]NER14117.1 hypothetical protein [Leptobacterium flavescens]
MRKILLLSISFLFCVVISPAQEKNSTTITDAYQKYFELPRETIFLHLNKSTYLLGEEIWFKGYIYDRQSDTPATKTSNIHIGIYDDKGNQINKKLFLGFNGYTRGNIEVDSTFASGEYYIKASTNWMRNFTEDDSFVQKIRIINLETPKPKVEIGQYDLQLLPEGGHLIKGIRNTVGFKLIDQKGFGVAIEKGVLLDKDENTLLEFKSNSFGMGKFITPTLNDQEYKVVATLLNGETVEASLSGIRSRGIGISVNNLAKENVIISLNTNDLTLQEVADQQFQLLIHKNGEYSNIPVQFKTDRKNTLISLKRENLFKGINTVTLFNEKGDPILERMFFNNHEIEHPDVSVTRAAVDEDSLSIKFRIDSKGKSLQNFSVSVLPEGTGSYDHQDNILSAFLLKPYLRGHVENAAYYFRDMDRKKEYDLDILLLTQGWSRYNWDQIFSHSPKPLFEFRNGITLKGRFNEKKIDEYEEFFIFPSGSTGSKKVELSGPQFEVVNLFPQDKDTLRIALINKKRDLIKPKLSVNLVGEPGTDRISHLYESPFYRLNAPSVPDGFLQASITELDEVVLSEKKKEKKDPDARGNQRVDYVDQDFVRRFYYVTQYIESRGYAVRENPTNGRVFINVRSPRTINGTTQPAFFLNGILSFDFDILYKLPSSSIEKIIVDQNGYGGGLRGANGVIKIWLRTTPLITGNEKAKLPFFEMPIEHGFSEHKKFYTPKYQTYLDSNFRDYGVIHWASDVIPDENGEAVIKIVNTKLNNISFFIEGMGKDGSIFSSVKTLSIE